MVAEMASCGASTYEEEGDGDIPAPEDKDNNQTESDNSSSDNTGSSSDESSGEEDNEEEIVTEAEDQTSASGSKDDTEVNGHKGKEDRPLKFCCEKCKAIQQSHGNELVTPTRIAKGRLQVKLDGEGTYECTVTGLVFEASEPVVVRYSVLSWTKFGAFLVDSWRFAGPIFNVDTVNKDASVLKSIQFPHSVCLADPDSDRKFSVLHIKNQRPIIEPTVDHSGSHVKWHVTSLSPVGPMIQASHSVEHHGVVLIYKQVAISNNCHSFHIYLATNSTSDIKDIRNQVRGYKSRYISINKPPTCKLDEGTYRLLCEPEGEVKPQELKFTLAVTKMKGYFEAFFEQPPPFKMSLIETSTDATVWSATIREGDCVDQEKKPRKR
uniref:Si:dkeyp-97b10.3 n=1 Tax=Neogobius melanostomus TaxID=47308 RepID=A0A8C6SB74_9GOBI